jgi:hypothetical protein
VGAVLEHYDTDKQFPAWGFGAALPPSGTVSHCFALNGNPADPEVAGVQGILEAYRHTLSSVRLSGPTLFAPIITTAAQVRVCRAQYIGFLQALLTHCLWFLLAQLFSHAWPPPICRLPAARSPALVAPALLCAADPH